MTTVYVLWDGMYEDREIVGVFASLDAAQIAHGRHPSNWQENGRGWTCAWSKPARPPQTEPVRFETKIVPVVNGIAIAPDGRQIRSDAQFVQFPVLPPGYWFDSGSPAQSCDGAIDVYDVEGDLAPGQPDAHHAPVNANMTAARGES
jgi:hypothetical protein